MRLRQTLIYCILIVAGSTCYSQSPKTVITVGIYQNSPTIFINPDGQADGLYIDILNDIATENNWNFEFVKGSFQDCLDRLSTGEIDILAGVACSGERMEAFNFSHEAIFSNWGQVYSHIDSDIESITDLQGKRVAGLKGSLFNESFIELINAFSLDYTLLSLDEYSQGVDLLQNHDIDVFAINRLYNVDLRKNDKIKKTSIVYSPEKLYVAASFQFEQSMLDIIDAYLLKNKKNPKSQYSRCVEKWFMPEIKSRFTLILRWLVIVIVPVIVLLILGNILLKAQVKRKTAELQAQNTELELEISKRKTAESELIKQRESLAKRVDDQTAKLTKTNDELRIEIAHRNLAQSEREKLMLVLEEKNNDMQRFLQIVTHDLRTPLVNIHGFSKELEGDCMQISELISSGQITENAKQTIATISKEYLPASVEFIASNCKKMEHLLDALSRLSRAGRVDINISKLDMNELITRVISSLSFQIKEKKAKVIFDKNLPSCLGDSSQIDQVFTNLISNALKYSDPNKDSSIKISAKLEDENSVYIVADNGIGIPIEHQVKVFDVFHRVNPNSSISGEGIGLTTVKQILTRNNGRIFLESKPGIGTSFYIVLPFA